MKTKILATLYIVGLLIPFWKIYLATDLLFNYLRQLQKTTFKEELQMILPTSYGADSIEFTANLRVENITPDGSIQTECRIIKSPEVTQNALGGWTITNGNFDCSNGGRAFIINAPAQVSGIVGSQD